MIDYLNSTDTHLFLFLNERHNAFFDPIMYWLSNTLIWLPMYLLIAFIIVRQYKMKGVVLLLFLGVVTALCDQVASHLIKNIVLRLRPSHEPSLTGLIHLSKAGVGGMYGFVSSHAANAFGFAAFIGFVLDSNFKVLKYWLFIWAFLVSYSRIYNGVHYPGDVIVGGALGMLIGWAMSKLYQFIESKHLSKHYEIREI